MRVFLMLLIFAIGFSGYATAAAAFMGENCNPVATVQTAADMDTPCPVHSAVEQSQEEDAGQNDNAAQGKCLDCTHCCVSHAVNMPDSSFSFPLLSGKLNPPPISSHAGDFLFSLLRPPKSLV